MEPMMNPTVLTADEIVALPETTLDAIDGVAHRVMWRHDTSQAGRMTIAAGHHLGAHEHRTHAHHLWIVDGSVEILGSILGPGSYVHVPPGVVHDLDARGTDGCTLHYVYEP